MNSPFTVVKTFEPRQKSEPSNIDLMVWHPNFWGEFPQEYTKRWYIGGTLRSGGTIKIRVPGYLEFYVKPYENHSTRNGNHILCAVLACTRQHHGVSWAYLVDPDEVQNGQLKLLRNSDRYTIRTFTVHFPKSDTSDSEKPEISLKELLGKEIPALSVLDKKIF